MFVDPAGIHAVWQVEVLKGAPIDIDRELAHVTLADSVTVYMGSDQKPEEPLVFRPVILDSAEGDLIMRVPDAKTADQRERELNDQGHTTCGTVNLRIMLRPVFVFDWGVIRVEGMEEGDDGLLRAATWEIQSYRPN